MGRSERASETLSLVMQKLGGRLFHTGNRTDASIRAPFRAASQWDQDEEGGWHRLDPWSSWLYEARHGNQSHMHMAKQEKLETWAQASMLATVRSSKTNDFGRQGPSRYLPIRRSTKPEVIHNEKPQHVGLA